MVVLYTGFPSSLRFMPPHTFDAGQTIFARFGVAGIDVPIS
jgi:hypothetical protein